ncbi:sulfurtransferase complex subunit TusB [Rhodoblastus sp.]|uniref:sulfurtransferase complex subunit TusB n=1 Tax=Rhodoblastus sp. TaxID=1962975 RepID=UPI002629B46D|nr:sulfurtransferase complex subunit TusB [Rhodoblastus sp.]
MSTLHTVNKSPYERNAMTSCLGHVSAGDLVLLIEDGVLAARKGGSFAQALNAAKGACKIYVLAPDLAARGIGAGDVLEGVETVDYGGFVDLAASATRVCAWL